MPELRTAAEYRRLAAFFRERASRAPLSFLHESYMKLVAGYELLADQTEAAEQRSASNRLDDGSP
jgi:hypothetical protein